MDVNEAEARVRHEVDDGWGLFQNLRNAELYVGNYLSAYLPYLLWCNRYTHAADLYREVKGNNALRSIYTTKARGLPVFVRVPTVCDLTNRPSTDAFIAWLGKRAIHRNC